VKDRSQASKVVAAIRRAMDKFRHHQAFTARVKPFIVAEVGEQYTVCVRSGNASTFALHEIDVWGAGIEYNDRVHMSWSASKPWLAGMETELARCDNSDYEERLRDEAALHEKLRAMEAQVKALREHAAKLVEELPIPKSATLRAEPVFWQGPSSELREMFPMLFGRTA
jgi:hypothetical protein